YIFRITHVPRLEDWPVIGFMIQVPGTEFLLHFGYLEWIQSAVNRCGCMFLSANVAALSVVKEDIFYSEGRDDTEHKDVKRGVVGSAATDIDLVRMTNTHWNADAIVASPPKWWDGNGIPNSTNKYKEDQKVSWHATPFEERLEKALSEDKLIVERKQLRKTPLPPIALDENEGRVLLDMGRPISRELELIFFHTVLKGFLGECGQRGGYFEMTNIPLETVDEIYKVASISLSPNVPGQIFKVKGAMYSFPQIKLPPKAIEAAKRAGKVPDVLYCLKLLEDTCISISGEERLRDQQEREELERHLREKDASRTEKVIEQKLTEREEAITWINLFSYIFREIYRECCD
ncbi:glutamate--glyoxylate aminotransferase 2, partial [Tanacetum coccineum]